MRSTPGTLVATIPFSVHGGRDRDQPGSRAASAEDDLGRAALMDNDGIAPPGRGFRPPLPDVHRHLRATGQEMQLAELETRRLREASEQRDLLAKLDSPGLVGQVIESYGSAGVSGLLDVVRHAEHGTARPRSLEVHPTDSSADYPNPPKELPPPLPRHPNEGSRTRLVRFQPYLLPIPWPSET